MNELRGQNIDKIGIKATNIYAKGEKGDKGDRGEKGDNGETGYTPVKGLDYYTQAEQEELKNSIITIIKNTVNDLVYYYNKSQTYSQEEINSLISTISTMNLQVVQTLPTQDISTTTMYLLPKQTEEIDNSYDEYIYISNKWEKIGSTRVNLTGYATETWVNTQISNFLTQAQIETLIANAISGKQNKLVSGTNIKTINGESILGEGDMEIANNNVYDDQEKVVGTWFGKPLYRRVFTGSATGSDTLIVSGFTYDIVKATCVVIGVTTERIIINGGQSVNGQDNSCSIYGNKNNGNLRLYYRIDGQSNISANYKVIIEYIKTTD